MHGIIITIENNKNDLNDVRLCYSLIYCVIQDPLRGTVGPPSTPDFQYFNCVFVADGFSSLVDLKPWEVCIQGSVYSQSIKLSKPKNYEELHFGNPKRYI